MSIKVKPTQTIETHAIKTQYEPINKVREQYKLGTEYLDFYKEMKEIKELVGLHTGPVMYIGYEFDPIYISIIYKNNKASYITLPPAKARLLYDFFQKPTPTEILKYFVNSYI